MIRINLLPVRQVKKRSANQQQVVLFAVLIVAGLVANFFWFSARQGALDKVSRQVSVLQNDIATLDRTIGEVNAITARKKELEDKLAVLDKLEKGRSGPVKMLDALASAIPKKVWLNSMTETSGAVTFAGSALSHEDLAEFMRALANVVWTPRGMGRIVESQPGGTSSRVELFVGSSVESFAADQLSLFFKNITLKKAVQAGADMKDAPGIRPVDFTVICNADYSA